MHIFNDYDYKIANQFLESNSSLKGLSISNKLNDAKCYNYLFIKYTQLKSFTFTLH